MVVWNVEVEGSGANERLCSEQILHARTSHAGPQDSFGDDDKGMARVILMFAVLVLALLHEAGQAVSPFTSHL